MAPPIVKPTRDLGKLAADLERALLAPEDRAGMKRLLADLCTPAEIRTLAERWHVARLLEQGALTYREIHDATGVSTTTIVRVARFLRQEKNRGYRLALDKVESGNAE
ncbi:MAG: DNA-binding transcriptional regulator [Sphingomonadales bacterium]|nr:DNA-binding transcriptional regulator [Sphingomonadales bacterium]